MAMLIGDKLCTVGMSKDIWNQMEALGYPGEQFPNETPDQYEIRKTQIKAMCHAIATGVVNHIKDNAEVDTIVTTTVIHPSCNAGGVHPTGAGNGSGHGDGGSAIS